jgi:Na+/phosphate symporter
MALFIFSLFLFIQAIMLMKEGASDLAPLIRNHFSIAGPVNGLGFGWLAAYIVMSGSPVAAMSLALLDAGAIDRLSAFSAITGSRLGASLIVLLIGFVYVLRGRDRATSLSMGLLSLIVTGSVNLVGFFLGMGILRSGVLDDVELGLGRSLTSLTEAIFIPAVEFLDGLLPGWGLFLIGTGAIIVSFNLFDRSLPEMTLKKSQMGQISRLIYRPPVMFLLGAAVTLLSLSVSVSLSILVPLSDRGFVRRENVIPYIMGANITTFVDTLVVGVLLGNPAASSIVLVQMLSLTLVSSVVLIGFYRRYERGVLRLVSWATEENWNLALFIAAILVVPILLMVL